VPPASLVLQVQEEPYAAWSVVVVVLSVLRSTWLDDPQQGRYMDNRRSVTITNHDTQFGCWIRDVETGVIAGGYLAPGRSISMPLGSRCRVFAQGINPGLDGQNISFYQFATVCQPVQALPVMQSAPQGVG